MGKQSNWKFSCIQRLRLLSSAMSPFETFMLFADDICIFCLRRREWCNCIPSPYTYMQGINLLALKFVKQHILGITQIYLTNWSKEWHGPKFHSIYCRNEDYLVLQQLKRQTVGYDQLVTKFHVSGACQLHSLSALEEFRDKVLFACQKQGRNFCWYRTHKPLRLGFMPVKQ